MQWAAYNWAIGAPADFILALARQILLWRGEDDTDSPPPEWPSPRRRAPRAVSQDSGGAGRFTGKAKTILKKVALKPDMPTQAEYTTRRKASRKLKLQAFPSCGLKYYG